MQEATPREIMRHHDVDPNEDPWVLGPPAPSRVAIAEYDTNWPSAYAEIERRARSALGDLVLAIEHVGSTAVPGLPAKPVIDVDLTVADSAAESNYLARLEQAGFVLTVREPSWHQHRCLNYADPRANLHVWSPASPEVARHRLLRDWLIEHPDDAVAYADIKRQAAADNVGTVMDYNALKEPFIRGLLDRIFAARGWR